MDNIKIEWLAKQKKTAQIYSSGLEYCFISEDNKQIFTLVYCKDFLQDAIQAFYYNRKASIYSFEYDPSKDLPLSLTKTRLALANSSDKNFIDKIPSVQDFIHQIEKKLKLLRTTFYSANPPSQKYNSAVFLEGSNRWMLSPPMISLYTLLLRTGFVHKIGDSFEDTIQKVRDGKTKPYQSHDADYLRGGQTGIDRILKNGYARIFYKDPKRNYPEGVSVSKMHGSFGIVGYSSEYTKQDVRYWHRDLNKAKKEKAKEQV